MHFMLFPPISIKGTSEKELNLTGVESLKSFRVTPEKISFTLEVAGEMQTIDVMSFNSPTTDVNFRREPDDDYPLELMPMATIEFLEALAQHIKGYTLLTKKVPETGYLELFRGDLYPISVRGSDKNLYATTAELRPLRKDYFVALNNFLEIDFEEQLETSLATFVENVLQPMSSTMEKVFEQCEEQGFEDGVVNVVKDDFHSLIVRTEELISIVNYNVDQTAERNKAFLRLSLPVMLKQAIFDNFSNYVEVVKEPNVIRCVIKNRRIIDAEDLA
ncbi:MAG: hypothetical protein ACTSRJ_07050, partial [Candidatus Hodarchaeales archaeon]